MVISKIIVEGGPRRFRPPNTTSHFDALARSIIYQQLSKKAASTIYSRFVSALDGKPDPDKVVQTSDSTLRQAGLSASKVRFIKTLAGAVSSGTLRLEGVEEQTDEQIVLSLTKLPGIGRWTAEMFLMFRLGRVDVLPIHDAGIQRGLQIAYGLKKIAAPKYIERVGRKWAPYRSIASLYLWAAVDLGFCAAER